MHEFINLVTRSFREERESSSVKGFWEIIRLASQKDLTKGGKIISYPASNDKDFQHAHWEKPIDRISVEFPQKNQHSFPNNPFTVVLCSLILQRCIRNYYSLLLYSRNSNVNAPPRVKGGGGGKGHSRKVLVKVYSSPDPVWNKIVYFATLLKSSLREHLFFWF